jgi:CRISPR-associated protein Cas2
MMFLISYDINTNRTRNRVAKELLKSGLERVQYSVFIGYLTDSERNRLESKIKTLIDKAAVFSILIVPLHEDMLSGLSEISSQALDWEYLKGEKKVLIF